MTDGALPRPTISIVVPVFDTDPTMFDQMLRSVLAQTYPEWQLVLCDDASPAAHVGSMLDRAAAADPRVTVVRRQVNGGIAAATNDAIAAATGEFVALLDHDDALAPLALELVVAAIQLTPTADYLYSDEDKVTASGQRHSPFYKPGWSPDRLKVQMYTCHLGVLRRSLVEEVGGFRAGFEGAQDWDLVLRCTERARQVVHIPELLYSWREHPGSTALSMDAKPYAIDSQVKAVQEHLDRTGMPAQAIRHPRNPECLALQPRLEQQPLVSIVMPTAGAVRRVRGENVCLPLHALRSVAQRSTYRNLEVVLVVDASTPDYVVDQARALFGHRLTPLVWHPGFDFSRKCNLGAVHTNGEHLVLLNDDTEVISEDWVEQLLMFSMDPGVGAVGMKLITGDHRLQHVGVSLNEETLPCHSMIGFAADDPGYALQARLVVNTAAVTGACLMTRREVFEELGGLSEDFPINYNDIDYCLKVRQSGRRVVQNNQVEMYHFESLTRDSSVGAGDLHKFRLRWEGSLHGDPIYNRNMYPNMSHLPPATTNAELRAVSPAIGAT